MTSPVDSEGASRLLSWSTLRSRALRGSLWWIGTYPFLKAVQIGSSVVLARLLSPEAFGVVAISSVVVRAITVFSEFGIEYSLIQNLRDDDRFVNTAWTLQLLRGMVVALLCALLAGPIAAVYGESELSAIIRVIGVTAVLAGLRSTNYVTLNRTLQERPRALLGLAESTVSRGSMIAIAFIWPSAWSLVFGVIAGTLYATAASHFLPGRRNRITWDPESARTLIKFGSWVVVGSVIAYLGGQVDTLVLGKLVTSHLGALGLVGVYGMAQRVALLPLEAVGMLSGHLGFPVLAEVARREPHRLHERVVQLRRALLPIGLAMCIGVVVLAPWFFRVLYDDRYAAARWMAPLMTIAVWIGFLNSLVGTTLLTLGRTRVQAMTTGMRVVTSTGGGLLGFWIAGVPGFIVGIAIGDLLRHVAELAFLSHDGISLYRQDVYFTLLFTALSSLCVVSSTWGGTEGASPTRNTLGTVLPLLVLAAATGWAARGAWGVIRGR